MFDYLLAAELCLQVFLHSFIIYVKLNQMIQMLLEAASMCSAYFCIAFVLCVCVWWRCSFASQRCQFGWCMFVPLSLCQSGYIILHWANLP